MIEPAPGKVVNWYLTYDYSHEIYYLTCYKPFLKTV